MVGAIGATVAVAVLAVVGDRVNDDRIEERVERVQRDEHPTARAADTSRDQPRTRRRCELEMVPSTDTLRVVLHEAPAWTGVDIESDWAKSFRMVWDGPITSWTTMRQVRVPGLDHRMLDSIEPIVMSGDTPGARDTRTIRVKVRVVVPGDLEAALAWVAANPAVESARVEVSYVP
jgi:hypothetical protein